MRALLQRVSEARVAVSGEVIGEIGPGLMVLLCAMQSDGPDAPAKMARKIAGLRIFKDEAGKMNRSVRDAGGAVLLISQFTLAADTRSGTRPGFSAAAKPDEARALYEATAEALRAEGLRVETGRFAADMQVSLVNDGPVTIPLEI